MTTDKDGGFRGLKSDVERESRKTYKVQVLFLGRFEKQEAWQALLRIHPGFEKGTFDASWRALKKSNGRTPILNEAYGTNRGARRSPE